MRTVMLSTHGEVHHVVVMARPGEEENVLEFRMVGTPAYCLRTGEPTGKFATVKDEQRRARRTAEGLAAYYRASLVVV